MDFARPIKRLPVSSRLSVPAPGRTILSSVREWGAPLLESKQRLVTRLGASESFASLSHEFQRDLCFPRLSLDLSSSRDMAIDFISSTLLLNWIIGRATASIEASASLEDAESWLTGLDKSRGMFSSSLAKSSQLMVLEPIRDLDYSNRFIDIFPYAIEVFETGNEMISATSVNRKSKRRLGVFYTPSDVTDYVTDLVIGSSAEAFSLEDGQLLDPACGTGCFLIAALYKLCNDLDVPRGQATVDFASKVLFGLDISPLALQSTVYALAMNAYGPCKLQPGLLLCSLKSLGSNLCLMDSLELLDDPNSIENRIPGLHGSPTWIISNPPYIRKHRTSPSPQVPLFSDVLADQSGTHSAHIFLDFLRMIPMLTKDQFGAGGMVLPLSITYNSHTEFRSTREFMSQFDGIWRVASFDRTPDSLFGDDVKTRNSIVTFHSCPISPPELRTTYLLRWSSRTRQALFRDISYAKVDGPFPIHAIPKVGSPMGSAILNKLRTSSLHYMAEDLHPVSSPRDAPGFLLRNPKTAYNWLPFERVWDHPSGCPLNDFRDYRYWSVGSRERASAVFALTQSSLAYWWWRVWGDGFHLTDMLIRSMPIGLSNFTSESIVRLSLLGDEIWESMKQEPIHSVNSGTSTVSFRPYGAFNAISLVDVILSEELDLPSQAEAYLRDFWRDIIIAGRDGELTTNPALSAIANEFGDANAKGFKED